MADYHRVIGIDLGTTFSVVAAWHFDKQEVKVIPNRQGELSTPSVVYVAKDGRVSVGKAARDKLARDPGRVIIESKRLMGEQQNGVKAMVQAEGCELDPEVLAAYVLKELKICAEKMIGEPIHDAVITVPARFKESQKNATREAAKIAKLNPRLVLNEPTAAAVAYGLEAGEEQTFVVFDFGGGTFDVSVVRIVDEQTVEILGTGGDSRLGGADIDQCIVDHVLAKMQQQYGQDFSTNERLVGRLRLKAEETKINLCNEKQDQELFLEFPTPEIDEFTCDISFAEFERMIAPLIERTFLEIEVALKSAVGNERHELTMDDIDAFILVGGSSKIPTVERMLKEKYGKPVKSDLHPDLIVGMGAALMARNYEPSLGAVLVEDGGLEFDSEATPSEEITDTHLKDVVSHTLGIGLKDDVYDPLIPKDSVIPHKCVRKGYSTADDNQTSIYVPVYQGDNPKASLNFKLGEVVIGGLLPGPKGTHQFEVTFALDADGVFDGKVRHQQTNEITNIQLDRGDGAMTEKKRIAMAEVVETGIVPTSESESSPHTGSVGGAAGAAANDPIEQLVATATDRLSTLPANEQRELSAKLAALRDARSSNNSQQIALLVGEITMIITKS